MKKKKINRASRINKNKNINRPKCLTTFEYLCVIKGLNFKLFKLHLMFTMSQKMFNICIMITIESDLLESFDLIQVNQQFALKKAK